MVDMRTITTATNGIFRIAALLKEPIKEIYNLFNCFE